jgi:cullin-associated NEDD8-dissociated protein 1
MSRQKDTFTSAIDHFEAEQEEIRAAAAFAAGWLVVSYHANSKSAIIGNIAIGNLHQFLPAIIKMVESDPKKRLLSLHALKEVSCGFVHYVLDSRGFSRLLPIVLGDN